MGFREDPFHDLYEGVNTYSKENDRFGYPGPGYRNLTKEGKFEEIRGMQRGYIRNIPTAVYDVAPPTIRCNFQFNPATLMQSVNAETAVIDMVRQSPEQYSRPKQGNTNLAFNLKFDRSYELNNFGGTLTDNNVDNSNDQNFNLWSRSPGEVGVYHDIDALYRVIGQGAYSDTKDYLKEIVKRRSILELNDIEGGSSGDWSGGDVGSTDISASNEDRDGTFEESLDYLVGDQGGLMNNTAFLVPQPVRLVFSSLFVVEGHVMASNVTYSRWTPSLVPIMADVSLTIDAKDIGFSRKKMFLTSSLEEAASIAEKEIEEAQEAQQEAVTEALSIIKSAQVGIMDMTERERGGLLPNSDDSWGNTGDTSKNRSVGHVLWHLDNAYTDNNGSLKEGKQDSDFSTMFKSCYLTGSGDEDDKLEEYFKDNVIKDISMGYNVELYGPYTASGDHGVKYSVVTGGQVPQSLVNPERTARESTPRHGNTNSNLLTKQSGSNIKVSSLDQFKTFFRYKSYQVEENTQDSSTDGLYETARSWRSEQDNHLNGVAQVSRSGRVPMTARGPHSSAGYIDLIRGRIGNGSEKGAMDSDLREEIYVYKWTVNGKVSFGEGEGIKADVATTKAEKWGYGTVADLFDQEHGKSREEGPMGGVGDRRFTMQSNIQLSWVSTAVTASVEASSPTAPNVPDDPMVPIRGLPAKSSSNTPGVELRGGAYARPRSSGSTPRRRDRSLAGIDPNGAARADKRKKDTPGVPSFTEPNKDGKGPSFPI